MMMGRDLYKMMAIACLTVLVAVGAQACCKSNPSGFWCKAGTVTGDCAKAEGTKELNDLISKIEAILNAVKGDPIPALDQLEQAAGDIFSCAWAKITGTPSAPSPTAAPSVRAERIKLYGEYRRAKGRR